MAVELSLLPTLAVLVPGYFEEPTFLASELLSAPAQAEEDLPREGPQWRPSPLWQLLPPFRKKSPTPDEKAAAEFLKTGVIDMPTSQRLELYIYAKAEELDSNPKINPNSLLDLAVLAEGLLNHVNARRVHHIAFKLAHTIQIYLSAGTFKIDPLHRQLIQENIAFVKEAVSAAFAMGEFKRAFQLSLVLFHQGSQFLQWGKQDEDFTIQREAIEARLWVKLFVAKIAEHPEAEGEDIKLEADAFLTSFAVDVDRMTDHLRRLAYEKAKNSLPSTDRLVAEALLKLAEGELSEEHPLGASRRFQNLALFQQSCPDSFSPCDIAWNMLRAGEAQSGVDEYISSRALIEATRALREFNSKKRKPLTQNPITLAPWQIDCLKQVWLDLRLTILSTLVELDFKSKEMEVMLSNLSTQIAQASSLLKKLKALASAPNAPSHFRRYHEIWTQIHRLDRWIKEGTFLLEKVSK